MCSSSREWKLALLLPAIGLSTLIVQTDQFAKFMSWKERAFGRWIGLVIWTTNVMGNLDLCVHTESQRLRNHLCNLPCGFAPIWRSLPSLIISHFQLLLCLCLVKYSLSSNCQTTCIILNGFRFKPQLSGQCLYFPADQWISDQLCHLLVILSSHKVRQTLLSQSFTSSTSPSTG